MNKITAFFSKPIFSDKRFIILFWFCIAFAASIMHVFRGEVSNNYLIFKYVFQHTVDQVNLYLPYPGSYNDCNHYGPVFSLLIAPFSFLPDQVGSTLWGIFISFTLFLAIYKLPLDWKYKVGIYYISAQELFTSILAMQTNPLVAALIIGSFIAIHKDNDFWAAGFIMLGFSIKLYGIVGLCFFFFSKHKLKLIAYLLLWGIIFFVLPMIISSPKFIIQTYQDWYHVLLGKNEENIASFMQDVSVMGMIRRISGHREISNTIILIPAMILFMLQYVKVNLYNNLWYRLTILSSTLLFLVLFSSGSESPTYIIAMAGVGIWFILQKRPYSRYIVFLLVFAIVLTSFSPTDIIPKDARFFIRQYSLKALPCFLIWITLLYQLFSTKKSPVIKN